MVAKAELTEEEAARMPITKHLRELRDRIAKSVIVLVATTVICFIFGEQLLDILLIPGRGLELQAIELVENLAVYFKIALAGGIILAMPYLVYQLFAYISPALTRNEKSYIYRIVPFVTIMFLSGVAFAYFLALPPALSFLSEFLASKVDVNVRISDYINIVTRMILYVGLIFETPVIIMFLARMGLVTPEWLSKRRRLWIVVAFIVAAIITPTFDPINQTIIALPLIILLEMGILLARFVYKKKREEAASEEAE
jgi:sec-independent protein translocase protein TatC